ncbi:MAG TPA: amidohydrolase family protein [Acidimicrobiales bacterium]|nr:amidohydrolase family protein [Acidimicrobiales bacterium]
MIVDVHAHHHPHAYTEALSALYPGARVGRVWPYPDTDEEAHIEARLALMETAGVGMQVLSPAAGRAPYGVDERACVDAARLVNDANAQLVERYPDKFRSFVSLPLPHIDASLSELSRGLDELGMVGVNLHISALNRSVAEDEFLPIYEEVNRRGSIIFYHPCANGICSPMITDYGLSAAVGTSLEDAVIALHLIAKRIPSRFPDVTFIIPHLGGPIPMLLERLDNQFSMKQHELPEPPSVTARRFYYDTVAHGSHAALLCAWAAFGADHLMPGSDYPVLLAHETYERTFSWIREVDMIPAADIVKILEQTAPAVLRLGR